jgi:hypothetical protein
VKKAVPGKNPPPRERQTEEGFSGNDAGKSKDHNRVK